MTKSPVHKAGTVAPKAAPKAREQAASAPANPQTTPAPASSAKPIRGKLAVVVELLSRAEGATSTELQTATGWQAHSVRGAIAGAVKKAGYKVDSERTELGRRYRIGTEAAVDQG